MPGCSQWTLRNSVQKCRLRKASMMGRFSGLSNARTFARYTDDIQRDSFHFPGSSLKANKRYVIQCVLAVSVIRLTASVLVIACARISSVEAVFNMLMFLVHCNC